MFKTNGGCIQAATEELPQITVAHNAAATLDYIL